MNSPARNYNLKFALFISIIGTLLYGGLISGQLFSWIPSLPEGNLGLFLRATEDQIINIHLQDEITDITFAQPGTYRIISDDSGLRARNLTIRTTASNEEIPMTILNQATLAPYDTNLLKGSVLLDFQIEEAGSYTIEVSNLNLNKIQPEITLFPKYTTQNRQRLIGAGVVLILILSAVWIKMSRPVVEKAVKQQKRDKWDEFMSEN